MTTTSRSSLLLSLQGIIAVCAVACVLPAGSGSEALPVSEAPPRHGEDPPVVLTPAPGSSGAPAADAGTRCPTSAALTPWLCDDFEGAAPDARWTVDSAGGNVRIKADAHALHGAGSLATSFGTLPAGVGRAALVLPRPASMRSTAFGMRFDVRVPDDGYPSRLALGGLRRAGVLAMAIELADGGHRLAVHDRSTGRSANVTLASLTFEAITCVSIEVDAAAAVVTVSAGGGKAPVTLAVPASSPFDGVEVGLTYDEGQNPNASIGLRFDDVVVGSGVRPCAGP